MDSDHSQLGQGKRLRNAIALGIAIAAGVGLGVFLSYEPDEEAAYQRSLAEKEARLRENGRKEWDARLARSDSARAAYALARASTKFEPTPAGSRGPSLDRRCGDVVRGRCPLTIDGAQYIVEADEDTIHHRGSFYTTTTRVRVRNDLARVVYEEDVATLAPGRPPATSIRVFVHVLQDATGAPRALVLNYLRQGPSSVRAFRILAPRSGMLAPIAPPSYGSLEGLVHETRLAEGNRLVTTFERHHFTMSIPYRVDLGCEPDAPTCVTLLLPDSISGLAKIEVDADSQLHDAHWRAADTTMTIELFPTPRAEKSERITLEPGTQVQVLGGAARILSRWAGFEGMHGDVPNDDWLQIALKGRTGWVRGAGSFQTLEQLERPNE